MLTGSRTKCTTWKHGGSDFGSHDKAVAVSFWGWTQPRTNRRCVPLEREALQGACGAGSGGLDGCVCTCVSCALAPGLAWVCSAHVHGHTCPLPCDELWYCAALKKRGRGREATELSSAGSKNVLDAKQARKRGRKLRREDHASLVIVQEQDCLTPYRRGPAGHHQPQHRTAGHLERVGHSTRN